MEKRVLEYVKKHQLIEDGDHVVVGLSGGADSVCLLLMLKKLQNILDFSMEAVHINHNLRGQEALRDQNFVDNLCKKLNISLSIKSVDVVMIAKEKKVGLEEAGRFVRYEIFEQYKGKIALAHHQNDLAETMIYHLARGTDVAGLAAMRPKRGRYIRPLLCMTRQEAETYLKEVSETYVTDSSNETDDYTRNRIRHHVLTYLEHEVNAKTARHMSQTAESLGELYDYLVFESEKKLEAEGNIEKDGVFLQEGLFYEPKVLVLQVLRLVMEKIAGGLKDIGREHLQMVYELAGKEVGKMINLPYEILAKKEYTGIWMGKLGSKGSSFPVESMAIEVAADGEIIWNGLCISAKVMQGNKEEIPEKIYTKWLDYDRMNCNLVLRYREKGDYIVVNQQGGRKKLKDYFIDIKLPQEERDRVPLLCRGQEVLWVVGHRIGESCKITEQTKNIIEIQIRGGKYHE